MSDGAWGHEAVGQDDLGMFRFVQVDVFTDRVFGGNPLAVFLDGEGLGSGEMQAIAREMNLSETVFLLATEREDCDVRLRIFTPGRELPFAGHPTLGAAYVLKEHGIRLPRDGGLVLEEGIGPVPVEFRHDVIWMRHPDAQLGQPFADRAAVAAMLGLAERDLLPDVPVQIGSTGNPFLFVALVDKVAVDGAALDHRAYAQLLSGREPVGVFVFARDDAEGSFPIRDGGSEPAPAVYSRMLGGRSTGISEDPATGSASGPLGAILVEHGLVPSSDVVRVVSRQGVAMGRPSEVFIQVEPGSGGILVGGRVVPVLTGTLTLPADAEA